MAISSNGEHGFRKHLVITVLGKIEYRNYEGRVLQTFSNLPVILTVRAICRYEL